MAFPTTSLLDAFTGANENPIATNWSGPTRGSGDQLWRLSNAIVRQAAGTSFLSWYDVSSFAADQEAWMTVSTLPAAAGSVSVTCRISEPNSANVDFYQWTYTVGTGWRMFKVINNAYTQIGSTTASPAMAAGEKIGFEVIGSTLRGMHYTGGAWSQIQSSSNSDIVAGGFIGAEIDDTTAVCDDFGGGTVVSGAPFVMPHRVVG